MADPSEADPTSVVGPGTPSFRCLADECGALCCRSPYRVDLGEDEVTRLAAEMDVAEVLDERASLVLLRQVDDACVLLGDDLRCRTYEVRPRGCRHYPFRLESDPVGALRIVRDLACPGFVGPPMTESEYRELGRSLLD